MTGVDSNLWLALDLAVRGPHAPDPMQSMEDLIWQAGEHRRQIEVAHSKLDVMGAPRKLDDVILTLAGRIDTFDKGY